MKKLLLTLTILTLQLFAANIEGSYKITYGGFLNLGEAKATLITNQNTYAIRIEANTVGMAKVLTNNRVEIYESKGSFENNTFTPKTFTQIKKDDLKSTIKTFDFDYKNEKVYLHQIKEEIKSKYDKNLQKVENKFKEESNTTLDFFAKNDLLSLFFNLNKLLLNIVDGKEYTLKAVGANKTKGEINVIVPNGEKKVELESDLDTKSKTKFIAYINQRIFSSARGELLISLNSDGFCNKAILKDVLLFGDIKGEMVKFNKNGD